jgi:hypothetical protein
MAIGSKVVAKVREMKWSPLGAVEQIPLEKMGRFAHNEDR